MEAGGGVRRQQPDNSKTGHQLRVLYVLQCSGHAQPEYLRRSGAIAHYRTQTSEAGYFHGDGRISATT